MKKACKKLLKDALITLGLNLSLLGCRTFGGCPGVEVFVFLVYLVYRLLRGLSGERSTKLIYQHGRCLKQNNKEGTIRDVIKWMMKSMVRRKREILNCM